MAITKKLKILLGSAAGLSFVTLILLIAASTGGAWEGASISSTQPIPMKVEINFGLAHVSSTVMGQSFSLSYSDMAFMLRSNPAFQKHPEALDKFSDLQAGGQLVSAMLGLTVTCAVLHLASLALIWPLDKYQKFHKLSIVFAGLLFLFSSLSFGLWLAVPHKTLEELSRMEPEPGAGSLMEVGGLSLFWCLLVTLIASIVTVPGLVCTVLVYRTSLQPPEAPSGTVSETGVVMTSVKYAQLGDQGVSAGSTAETLGANLVSQTDQLPPL